MQGLVYLNGEFVSADQATLSIFDTGFQLGLTVFDTLLLAEGRLFRLDAHIERFFRSAEAIRLPGLPITPADLRNIVLETVRRSGLRDAAVTMIATRGVREPGTGLWGLKPTLIVQCVRGNVSVAKQARTAGVRACITAISGIPAGAIPPQVKHYNRIPNYLSILEARDRGVDDSMAIFLDDRGNLTEGASFNLFMVRGGAVLTPADGMLRGITRDTMLKIAQTLGLPARETTLNRYDLYTADEAFATSISRGAVPIVEVDGRPIGDGAPGPITERLNDTYWAWRREGPYVLDVYADAAAGQPATSTSR